MEKLIERQGRDLTNAQFLSEKTARHYAVPRIRIGNSELGIGQISHPLRMKIETLIERQGRI